MSGDDGDDDQYASRGQQIAILIVQAVSSIASTFGSGSIIYIILRHEKWKRSMFHRLMLGLSVGDSIVSISTLISPYLQPPDVTLLAASGNTGSCSFVAFLLYAILSNVYYNCFIAIFYYRTIKVGEREERLSQRYEKWMHGTAVGLALSFNIVALSLAAYNPSESARICDFAYFPPNCDNHASEQCTRGLHTTALNYLVLSVVTLPAVTGIVLTLRVYTHVNHVYNKSRKYRYGEEAEERTSRRMRQMMKQAVVYCWAFCNSFVWGVSLHVFESVVPGDTRANLGRPGIFAYLLLHAFFFPLQGFINFFVYTRPRFWKYREMHPDQNALFALTQVYHSSTLRDVPPVRRTQRVTTRRSQPALGETAATSRIVNRNWMEQGPPIPAATNNNDGNSKVWNGGDVSDEQSDSSSKTFDQSPREQPSQVKEKQDGGFK